MPPPNTKIQANIMELRELLKLLDNKQTMADMVKILKQALQVFAQMKLAHQKQIQELRNILAQTITEIRKRNEEEKGKMKDDIMGSIRVPKDGKDADEEKIKKDIFSLIPAPLSLEQELPKHGELIRDALELLQGEDKLEMSAVKGLAEALDEVKRQPLGGRRGGGLTDVGVQYALGRIIKTETPSGAINNVNTAYTVGSDIHAVLAFSINGQVISDREYTISGRTITMNRAITNDLAGTNFRITYV